jgi:hypothetical protein
MFEVRHARSPTVNNFSGAVNGNAYAGRVRAIKLGDQSIDGESLGRKHGRLPDLCQHLSRTEY